jgi:hypothetical protein
VRLRQFRNRSIPEVQTQIFKPRSSNPDIQTQIFKPLSPETIKARRTKPNGAASMCPNEEILSQCNRINPELPPPSGAVTNPK